MIFYSCLLLACFFQSSSCLPLHMNVRHVPQVTQLHALHSKKSFWYVTVIIYMAGAMFFHMQLNRTCHLTKIQTLFTVWLDMFSSSNTEYQHFVHRAEQFTLVWQVRNLSIQCLNMRWRSHSTSGGRWIIHHNSTTLCFSSARSKKHHILRERVVYWFIKISRLYFAH